MTMHGRMPTEAETGEQNLGFWNAGSQTGDALDFGLGLFNSDNLDIFDAAGRLGGWDTENGFQIGFEGGGAALEAEGDLGDVGEFLGLDTTDSEQGGWENFLSGEAHALQAGAEGHIGTDGGYGGFGGDAYGASVKVGGAEYDWLLFGSELEIGGAVGGAGGGGGLHWSDDDGDGLREMGFSLGVDVGLGGDVSFKNEFAHTAYNAAADVAGGAWDWAFGEGEE